ncbi:MAG: hypothetical protein L6290_07915, partial [Thermodesulfovibrionales bacterium]|nr:hypothetical protein [Thermodesulfovibrionales bacterium]
MKKASKTQIVGCLIVPFLIAALGCGGNKVVKQNQEMADLNKPVLVEKTGGPQRPEWTNQTNFYEDESGIHFTGGVMGGS